MYCSLLSQFHIFKISPLKTLIFVTIMVQQAMKRFTALNISLDATNCYHQLPFPLFFFNEESILLLYLLLWEIWDCPLHFRKVLLKCLILQNLICDSLITSQSIFLGLVEYSVCSIGSRGAQLKMGFFLFLLQTLCYRVSRISVYIKFFLGLYSCPFLQKRVRLKGCIIQPAFQTAILCSTLPDLDHRLLPALHGWQCALTAMPLKG